MTRGANQGELQYKLVFLKHTKEWLTKPIMEKTSRDYLNPILDTIVERKKQKPQERSATLTAPHIPKNIPSKPSLAEQMLLLNLSQDFQTIKIKCTFDYATNTDCIKSAL